MDIVRPPADRFADLPGYDYDAHYVDVGDAVGSDDPVRMSYVDEGAGTETFLCLHGEPTWSYLYRKLIPTLADHGRVVAPDLLGFGRSDGFAERDAYTVQRHYDALAALVESLDLTDVTLLCQDWGGLLGLPYATRNQERFARLVPMNTGLPDGTQEMPELWLQFAEMVETVDDLDVARLVDNGCVTQLSADVKAAYNAPFTDEASKAGARTFPGLVPQDPDDPGAEMMAEATEALADWEKPAFVLFGDSDPIFHDTRDPMRDLIPTASDQPDVWVEGAGHFLQEDAGEEIAQRVVDFVDRT
jgi:haloalkane dehalogenase